MPCLAGVAAGILAAVGYLWFVCVGMAETGLRDRITPPAHPPATSRRDGPISGETRIARQTPSVRRTGRDLSAPTQEARRDDAWTRSTPGEPQEVVDEGSDAPAALWNAPNAGENDDEVGDGASGATGPDTAAGTSAPAGARAEPDPVVPAEWTPVLARKHWLEYLDARLDLTPFQEDLLRDLLDESRHPFAQWNPGLLNTRVSTATDPVLAMPFAEPFQEFRRFVGREQERMLLQVAPRWNSEAGRLEVRIVPER